MLKYTICDVRFLKQLKLFKPFKLLKQLLLC